jgi:hypothetical protein
MRCTNCRREVKPVVAIDIDGTLGDFHGHFINFINNYLGHTGSGQFFHGQLPMREWFKDRYCESDRTWADIKLAYRQGGQKRTMPCLPWSSKLVHDVLELGVELWITTTRPYLRLDSIDPDTRHWLMRNNIVYEHLLYDEHKYRELKGIVGAGRVVAVFDDLDEDLQEARNMFGQHACILAASSYNSAYHGDWFGQLAIEGNQAYEHIKSRVRAYREAGGSIRARIGDPYPA